VQTENNTIKNTQRYKKGGACDAQTLVMYHIFGRPDIRPDYPTWLRSGHFRYPARYKNSSSC